MQCPTCQRENRPQARFCLGCGGALPRRCPACDHELPGDAAFCDACGAPLSQPRAPAASARDPRAYTPKHLAERILTSRSALEGERKNVTVLFADVAGFTRLADGRDPEEVHGWMDRFFQIVLDEVHRYEGTVNQFLGDGAMALFGAPLALEDAPRRAVLAALGIQRRLGELRDESGVDLPLRIGIHSGPVVVGRIGDDLRMDYTAVGDTTNLAARLQQIATPGSVLVSEAARRQIGAYFDLEDLGDRELRGVAGPVRAWRVIAQRPVSGRIEAVGDVGLTPLVGRERELAALRVAFDTAREGIGQVCFLVGEAGIGKSRLLYEFRQRLGAEPHTWFEGRCASYGASTAFQALVDGLQRFFGIEDRDDEAAAAAKVERGVAARGDDLDWTLPFLRALLGLKVEDPAFASLDAVMRRSETLRALHALFLHAAERAPLVFAIEDLHWIDTATEEFLEFLIDSIPRARVCLLFTHRPGYRQPFGDRSYHARIALQSLSAGEMEAMAGTLLHSSILPAELRELVARKAEGNPFFVEEVTRSLLEEGALRLQGGRVELARRLDEISVPDSIQEVLMARIDRLDEEPKRAIQLASVIGREFAMRLLARIVETGDAVNQVVGELRALELIYQKASHPELAYMFKHALTHDVAYESVLVKRRKALHGIVGAAIEELYRDRLPEHFEALAHHFERAEEWERALDYHERAAQKASDTYANHSAAEHCTRALEIAGRLGGAVAPERRRRLAEMLGRCLYCVNRFRESGEAYEAAAAAASDAALRATNLARAAASYVWGHHYRELEATSSAALSLAAESGCDAAAAIALGMRELYAVACLGTAPLVGAPDPGSESAALAERSGDPEAVATVESQRGLVFEFRGEYERAIALSERAVAAARAAGAPHLGILADWTIGLARTCRGEYARGIAALGEAVDVSTRIGDRALRARVLNTLGWCLAEMGCHVQASEYNRQATVLAAELVELDLVAGAPELHANGAINLACNRIALGDSDEALELLAPIQRSIGQPGDPWSRWHYGLNLLDAEARARLALGDPDAALRLVEAELRGAREHGTSKLEARALELRGRALVALDRREEAADSVARALEVARAIGYPPVTWRALSLQAELARRAGRRGDAERLAASARELVEGLAAAVPQPELRREFGALGERLATDPLGAYR